MKTFNPYIFKTILAVGSVCLSSSIYASKCTSLDHMYESEGCDIVSSKYSMNAKIFVNHSGTPRKDKIFHVVSPYTFAGSDPDQTNLMVAPFIKELNSLGVDVAYYDLQDMNNRSIEEKAHALSSGLRFINKQKGWTTPSIILGISTGGVVARVALKQLENANYRHGVKYYVSFDAPHLGAHIPPSLQHVPKFISEALNKAHKDNTGLFMNTLEIFDKLLDETIDYQFAPFWDYPSMFVGVDEKLTELKSTSQTIGDYLNDQINSPAAKQLIIHNIYANNERHRDGEELVNRLKKDGLPKGIGLKTTNIAITNGSLSGKHYSHPNPLYIRYDSGWGGYKGDNRLRLFSKTAVNSRDVDYHYTCNRQGRCYYRSQFYGTLFFGRLDYFDASNRIRGDGIDQFERFYRTPYSNISGEYQYDAMACSVIALPAVLGSELRRTTESIWPNPDQAVEVLSPYNCFIPVVSALSIYDEPMNSSDDLAGKSPFDKVYGSSTTKFHNNTQRQAHREYGNGNYFKDDLATFIRLTYEETNWKYNNTKVNILGNQPPKTSCGAPSEAYCR